MPYKFYVRLVSDVWCWSIVKSEMVSNWMSFYNYIIRNGCTRAFIVTFNTVEIDFSGFSNPRGGLKTWVIAQCVISTGVFPMMSRHYVKSVRIWSYSGPYFPHSDLIYSIRMRENADQNNSEYKHFSRSVSDLDLNLACVILKASC